MSEQKFPPRVWISIIKGLMDEQVAVFVDGRSCFIPNGTPQYLSLAEHQHLMAEKDRRIERLREALGKIQHMNSAWVDHVGGTWMHQSVARAALQEDK